MSRRAVFWISSLLLACTRQFAPQREAVTLDCFGTACDTSTSVCCFDSNPPLACELGPTFCTNAFECFADTDCVEKAGSTTTIGVCCGTVEGSTPSFEAGANTSAHTTCVFSPQTCDPPAFAVCDGLGSVCRNSGTGILTCAPIIVGNTTMPFGSCQ